MKAPVKLGLRIVWSDMMGRYEFSPQSRRDLQAEQRAAFCAALKCPVDSCMTTGELIRDAHQAGIFLPFNPDGVGSYQVAAELVAQAKANGAPAMALRFDV